MRNPTHRIDRLVSVPSAVSCTSKAREILMFLNRYCVICLWAALARLRCCEASSAIAIYPAAGYTTFDRMT